MTKHDVVIYNARIIDGKGNPWRRGNVAIKDGRISQIGRIIETDAREHIDAQGMFVCPGFIDTHSHSDFVYFIDSTAQSKVRQGVTTEVTGNCGFSGAPWTEVHSPITIPGFSPKWTTMKEYLEALVSIGKPVNIAPLVGHNTLRTAIVGLENRPCTSAELEQMVGVLADSLRAGAHGLSTGLYFAPGSYATREELRKLFEVAACYGTIVTSHIRDEGTRTVGFLSAIREILDIAGEAQVPVHISHIKVHGPAVWGSSTKVLELIEEGRRRGIEVSCDQYPYEATGGSIADDTLPLSFLEGKTRGDISRELEKADVRRGLHPVVAANIEQRGGASRLTIADYAANPQLQGKTIQEHAEERGTSPADAVMLMLAEGKGCKAHWICFSLKDEDVEDFMRYAGTMIGSDGSGLSTKGPLSGGYPHPRNFGAFPRILRLYVKEKRVLRLEDAIRKMTSLPAQTFGLSDRGVLEEGNWADIVIFELEEIIDAPYDNPKRYPEGIPYVMVNGEWVIKRGDFTGNLPGQALQHRILAL